MNKEWYTFQEEIKEYFTDLGFEAKTNVTLQGIRTTHDIDVHVKSKFLGLEINWIIEAKKWKTKISKLHVLALRQIVDDIGVDKGFIISEKGFQQGAVEATLNTNIKLITFKELKDITDIALHKEILKNQLKRVNVNLNRYYSHTKAIRIKYGLREDRWESAGDFNVYILLVTVVKSLNAGIKNDYPIDLNTYLNVQFGEIKAETFNQLINWLNLNLLVIEERILKAEVAMQANGEFNPQLHFLETEDNFHIKALNLL